MVAKIVLQCVHYLKITIFISDNISCCSGEYRLSYICCKYFGYTKYPLVLFGKGNPSKHGQRETGKLDVNSLPLGFLWARQWCTSATDSTPSSVFTYL